MATKKQRSKAAAELGRRGGLKGGAARAAALTPERRREISQKALAVRYGKPREQIISNDTPPAPAWPAVRREGMIHITFPTDAHDCRLIVGESGPVTAVFRMMDGTRQEFEIRDEN